MQKLLSILILLFISVITTACINNFAVQELNNKAKEYLENGDTQTAICRLKSSLDLDNTVYETHYNLGIAYLNAKEYENALKEFDETLKLKPDFSSSYFSKGIVYEDMFYELSEDLSDENKTDDIKDDKDDNDNDKEDDKTSKITLSQEELLSKSIENYKLYLENEKEASDYNDVSQKINELEDKLSKLNEKQ